MRLIFSLLTCASLAAGGWYMWDALPPVREFVQEKVNSNDFRTLEIRYTAEEIMRANKEDLLKNKGYSYLEPQILYYPYVLLDVKYSKDRATTSEGLLIWGLTDGEMVLDATSWEKTHGFEDCLLAKASKNDFKIIQALVENGGSIDREKLYHRFKVDYDILDNWLDSCRDKKLIVISGNKFRLHFENPQLGSKPITHLNQALVHQPARYTMRVKKRYSLTQIRRLTETAFGKDFAIRKVQEVFLPVYNIGIQNPDGSRRTVFFNALNGKEISDSRQESL